MTRRLLMVLILFASLSAAAAAQQPIGGDVVLRGIPSGQATDAPLSLSLRDAITRGLEHNLGTILQEQQVRTVTGGRLEALSELLPHTSADVRQSVQVINTAAFGFSGFGDFPNLIGPFSVFDARVAVSAPVVDVSKWQDLKAENARVSAAQADYRQVRETVILAVANLYLQALTDQAREDSARAEVATAEALSRLAVDQKDAGLIAQVDVLRQQVQLEDARTRLITFENQRAKRRLQLARAIGLPAGQTFELTDRVPFAPAADIAMDAALREATEHRDDLRAAEARVVAARADRLSASTGRLPSVRLDGDLGAQGLTAGSAQRVYSFAVTVHVPIFAGGETNAKVVRADADVKVREAELADLQVGVRNEIEESMLDIKAAAAGVASATSGRSLAQQALTQAQDRFRAGVSSTIELVQAEDALTRATEQYFASVYAHNVAKASLAQALGEVEESLVTVLGGQQ